MIEWHLWLALHSKLVHFTTEYALMDSPPHSVLTFPLPSIISKKHSYTELLKVNSIRFWWNEWWGEKAGFFTCAGSSPQSSAPLRPVEILHEEYNIQLYVGIVKSSQSQVRISVKSAFSSESEIFAFRSFCPISATTLYATPNPKWNPPDSCKMPIQVSTKAFLFEVWICTEARTASNGYCCQWRNCQVNLRTFFF